MLELQLTTIGLAPLLDKTERGKDQLLGPLAHDQMQQDREGHEQPSRQQ
jgi:hypothetical protein